jgi:pilus assembly protein CpaB
MNQSKAFMISAAAAIAAMFLVFFYISDETDRVKKGFGTEVVVVVANRDINELEEIQTNMLTTKTLPKSFVQPGSDPDPKTFEGSTAAAPIKAGEQVLLTKVLLKGAATGIASQVAIHRRALSIPVNDVTGVTRLLRPGDRVDIIAKVQYKGLEGMESEIKTVMQNVTVLAVGELVQNNIPAAFERDPISGNRKALNLRGSRAFNTVTVEVTPQDAQKVIFVVEEGANLFLTLRNPVDQIIAPVSTVTVDEVLGQNSRKSSRELNVRAPAAAPVQAAPPPKRAAPAPAFLEGGIPIAD